MIISINGIILINIFYINIIIPMQNIMHVHLHLMGRSSVFEFHVLYVYTYMYNYIAHHGICELV